jgi:hypothetical protein
LTTKQLLDLVLNHFVLIGTSDATNATWRERALERAQEVVEEVFDYSDWDFKQSSTTLSVLAGDTSVAGPADLATIGENGGLFISGLAKKLRYLQPGILLQQFEEATATTQPRAYAVISQNTSNLPLIHFDVTANQAYTLKLYYDTTPPVLIDAPGAPNLALAAGGELEVGAYREAYTFVAGSLESEIGEYQTITTTGGNERITVTFGTAASSFVTARKIYRTVVAGTQLKLVGTISDNITTSYLDVIPDASLGVNAPTTSSLTRIPQEYHRSVLQRGLIARLSKDFNDPRAMEHEAAFQSALARMKARRVAGIEDDERILEGGIASWASW